jgi:predicted nucleotidyltransferase
MIDPDLFTSIQQQLDTLEAVEGVKLLYAVESGSRAWGFPSRDSDYDVRFIYVRPLPWYLSVDVDSKRDVITRPLEGDLDVDGWDLRKALQLFAKSNPPLLEWLDSSIVYLNRFAFAERLRHLRAEFFSPQACAYHYLHMAQGNYRTYLRGEKVWLKKYFYVLRPLLAVRWIEQRRGVVPMSFARLLETVADQPELLRELDFLLQRKMAGEELDEGPSIPVIQSFLDVELARLEKMQLEQTRGKVEFEKLNELFRQMLREAWQETS